MTLDEIFRRIVRGHLWAILCCIAVPLVAISILQLRAQPIWTATVRVQVSTQDPSSTTEADALSSRVLALATTPSLVADAIANAKLSALKDRAGEIAKKDVSAERLGESPVVNLTVSLHDKDSARLLDVALANRVITFMNRAAHANVDRALAETAARLGRAAHHRDQVARQLAGLTGPIARQNVMNQLDDAQATVDQLNATKASMQLAALERDEVVVVDGRHPTLAQAPSTLVPRTALGLILGLLIGVAVAVTLETLNPRVAGTRALARLLSAPLLGNADQRLAAVTNAMTLGARRHGVETVVLLGVDDQDDGIVHEMLDVLSPSGAVQRERVGADLPDRRKAAAGERAEEDVAEGGPSIPVRVRFCDLVGVTPADEPTAGVVVVTSGSPRQADVDVVEDILAAMRWPVIGIIEVRSHLSRTW